MVSLKYLGDREELKGSMALIQLGIPDFVKVQFQSIAGSDQHPLCHNWHDFLMKDFMGPFRIRYGALGTQKTYYRVCVQLPDGEWDESMLYTWDEAIEVVRLGLAGALQGSFAIRVPAWQS